MANKQHNPLLKPYAQKLRKEMTKEERRLWYDFLKLLPITVKRQQIIGPYIADFYIPSANLIIELDGSQHYDTNGMNRDQERDAFLKDQDMTVLRYTNLDVAHRFRSVCDDILIHLQKRR